MKKQLTNTKKADYTTIEKRARRGFKVYATIVLVIGIIMTFAVSAFAADAMAQVNNLKDFLFNLMTTIGAVLIGFGVVQLGLSLKSHDPSQRGNAILTIAGGIVIACIKPIVTLITG